MKASGGQKERRLHRVDGKEERSFSFQKKERTLAGGGQKDGKQGLRREGGSWQRVDRQDERKEVSLDGKKGFLRGG